MMMKKIFVSLLTALLALSVCAAAFAQERPAYVTDEASLLTAEQLAKLDGQAKDLSETYNCGIYIITVEDFTEYTSSFDICDAAQEVYLDYNLGLGEEKSGVALLFSLLERDYCLYAYGYGKTAFADFGIDCLEEAFLDNFNDADYYGGCQDFIMEAGEILKSAQEDLPEDVLATLPIENKNNSAYIVDAAEIFTSEQFEKLSIKAKELSETYNCGIYIITVKDFTEYTNSFDVAEATQEIYFDYNLGLGEKKSGVALLFSLQERDYCLYAYGYGNTAFTDFGKDCLANAFLDNFSKDDYYGGSRDYINVSGRMLEAARKGKPIDVDNELLPPHARVYGVIACIVIGLLVAGCINFFLTAQLQSVRKKTEASEFVTAGGLRLIEKIDRYTHTTEKRVYDPPQKSANSKSGRSSSGSGGTTVNSRGGSSKSGKF